MKGIFYLTQKSNAIFMHGSWLNENNKELLCKHYKLNIENIEFIPKEHYHI
jgi:hypothetical protein